MNNWGTKWDIAETYQNEIVGDTLHLAFDTAWGPALEAYNTYYLNIKICHLKVITMNPDVTSWVCGMTVQTSCYRSR